MSIKWDIAEKINKCGYDMMTSLEMASNLIKEFLAQSETTKTYGVINMSTGKCMDTITMQKNLDAPLNV